MFPISHTVADGFHVRLLMNHHYSELCRVIDEKHLVYERCGMMRLLMTLRYRLICVQKEHLRIYFAASLGIKSLYKILYGTVGLFRVRAQNIDSCRRYSDELLNKIDQLRKKPFAPLRALGKALHNSREEVARIFHFTRNNCITECFYRKMKLVQRRAYGAFVTSKTTACVCAFCAAEMAVN